LLWLPEVDWLKKTLPPFFLFYRIKNNPMNYFSLFKNEKPLIACIHLLPLPGAPGYEGDMSKIIDHALAEVTILKIIMLMHSSLKISGISHFILTNSHPKPLLH